MASHTFYWPQTDPASEQHLPRATSQYPVWGRHNVFLLGGTGLKVGRTVYNEIGPQADIGAPEW